ncbi:hypothetical protein MSAN_01809900 [Mycena sanguinolenta]|uniref:MYND-type domain-containing protein n=1 Tax=Mycena sanguinolenta TaxID=230812 RepID=A0A8H6XSK1_9AGAR|nr:hypothetical protein MSAN_01809900 [Mycena sanguinolenta]
MSSLSPHVPSANTCANCDKHLRVIHGGTPRCDRCLPDDMTELKTCACHLARYCNAVCQKNDWETHRVACRTAMKNIEVARILGAEARHLSFVDWCKHSRTQFHFPALWALGAGTDADRTAELRQEFASRYSAEWKVPPAAPLCARIWIVDDGLPHGLESGDQLAEIIGMAKIRSQETKYRLINISTGWEKTSYGEQFAMAAYSALDVSLCPDRIVTRCLTLYVDVEEKRDGTFGKHTIRSAKMTSLPELRPLFHCDVLAAGSQIMRDTLFHRPNVLRTLIIDDALPFGRNIQGVAMDMSKAEENGREVNPDFLFLCHHSVVSVTIVLLFKCSAACAVFFE